MMMFPFSASGTFPLEGDIDNSGDITLQDAIMVIKITSGMNAGAQVYTATEVSGDNKFGTEEAIYILQCISELRTGCESGGESSTSVTIVFDYTYDTNGFFTPERRAIMLKAADALTSRMEGTTWARVDTDGLGGNYDLAFIDPSTLAISWSHNVVIPENQITIYLGAINFVDSPWDRMQSSKGSGATQLMSIRNVSGGIGNVLTTSTQYRPINASITFDLQGIQGFSQGITNQWHFDSDGNLNTDDRDPTDPHYNEYSDFYTTAIHELGHVMGIHNPDVFSPFIEADPNFCSAYLNLVDDDGAGGYAFTGSNAKQLYYDHIGQNIPLEVSTKCHWADGVRSVTADGFTSINHESTQMFRLGFSELEFGALQDMGYTISSN